CRPGHATVCDHHAGADAPTGHQGGPRRSRCGRGRPVGGTFLTRPACEGCRRAKREGHVSPCRRSPMNKLGLALSGGGFRASLFHLGLVRLLRDAGILSRVTHITSVSGGSAFAAHLVLHWDRYNGSPSEFDAAAAEFLSFVRLDIRNRIARRFPLAMLLRGPRRLLGRSNPNLTLPRLLH